MADLKAEMVRLRRLADSRRTRGPAYKHSRWARCVHCGILKLYKVTRQRRLRSQNCQECNRVGGLHPPTWWKSHGYTESESGS